MHVQTLNEKELVRVLLAGAGLALMAMQAKAQTSCPSTPIGALYPQGAAQADAVGVAVALNAVGDRLFVGGPGHDLASPDSGAVWVIANPGTSSQNEVELLQSAGPSQARFGTVVDTNAVGDVLIVGATG